MKNDQPVRTPKALIRSAFRDIPIKRKLTVVILLTAVLSITFSGAGIIVSDILIFRANLTRELLALAIILSDNATAPLEFDDSRTATELLTSLRARPHVLSACIEKEDGTVFASYARQGASGGCPPVTARQERFTAQALSLSRPIVLNGRRIGNLRLLYDLDEIGERTALYGSIVLAVLLASSAVAFLLSSTLRGGIAQPISNLARVSASVTATRDYSIRAEKVSNDELGVLVDAFNEMLAGIEHRDDELRKGLVAREAALREAASARDFLKTTLSSIGDGVISTDTAGRIVFANPAALAMLPPTDWEIEGSSFRETFLLFSERTGVRVENPLQSMNGSVHGEALLGTGGLPIEYAGTPIRGDSRTVYGAVLVFRDISARRKAEATSRLLASIVESSDDAIIGQDLSGTITSWNGGAERIFGYPAEEVLGQPWTVIAAPGVEDEMPAIQRRIARGERVGQYRASRRTREGTIVEVSITVSPLHDAAGRITGSSMICRDISSQVRAAESLERLNADLRRTNEDLERFAFVASHDLQEPLRMVSVFSQLLIESFPEEQRPALKPCVDNILEGTRRMRTLLTDLLAYTEIGGSQDVPDETVDLNLILEKVRQNLQALIDEAGAIIDCAQLPVLKGREAHFIPLFQNLIGNAIKYRREEPPRIEVSVEGGEGMLKFAVSDNGIGIEPQFHEKIFVPFKRLHGNSIPGTGIGLAICQRVTERYGGKIWVESGVGRGSRFLFTLPATQIHRERTYKERDA